MSKTRISGPTTEWERDYADMTLVRCVFIKAHWARMDLAWYLDRHPVLQFEFDGRAQIKPDADEDVVAYALALNERCLEADAVALAYERWYMSHPDLETRHHLQRIRVRDRQTPQQVLHA